MGQEKLFSYSFAEIYALYLQKIERKGRTKEELDQVLGWLTGYDAAGLQEQMDTGHDLQTFFARAPNMNPNAHRITGVICGIRVEEIEDPLVQKIRYMDKIVDELARGKKLEKIYREPQ